MKLKELAQLFDEIGECFSNRKFAELARLHRIPCVIFPTTFEDDQLIVIESNDAMVQQLSKYYDHLCGGLDLEFRPNVVRADEEAGRLQVDVRWRQFDRGLDRTVRLSFARYFLTVSQSGSYLIEMIEQLADELPERDRLH